MEDRKHTLVIRQQPTRGLSYSNCFFIPSTIANLWFYTGFEDIDKVRSRYSP